jgi:hypothetical protein
MRGKIKTTKNICKSDILTFCKHIQNSKITKELPIARIQHNGCLIDVDSGTILLEYSSLYDRNNEWTYLQEIIIPKSTSVYIMICSNQWDITDIQRIRKIFNSNSMKCTLFVFPYISKQLMYSWKNG